MSAFALALALGAASAWADERTAPSRRRPTPAVCCTTSSASAASTHCGKAGDRAADSVIT
jgi:hypothetical protein